MRESVANGTDSMVLVLNNSQVGYAMKEKARA